MPISLGMTDEKGTYLAPKGVEDGFPNSVERVMLLMTDDSNRIRINEVRKEGHKLSLYNVPIGQFTFNN